MSQHNINLFDIIICSIANSDDTTPGDHSGGNETAGNDAEKAEGYTSMAWPFLL